MRKLIAQIIYPQIFTLYDSVKQIRDEFELRYNRLRRELEEREEEFIQFEHAFGGLEKENKILKKGVTPLEQFCLDNFKEVDKFAYKDKGVFKDKRYPMYMNELIQPDLFIVKQIRDSLGERGDSLAAWAMVVADDVDGRLKYTGDGGLDNWQDMYATILGAKEDCENHAGLVSSIEPEFCICAGFAGNTYHAWNGFIHNGKLWCIETNSTQDNDKNARVFEYSKQSYYDLHFIFTQDRTFKCKTKVVHFGKIVR